MRAEYDVDISIVVPVYNEAENIEAVLDEIVEVMDKFGRSYEVIVVDDGSKDNSFEVLKRYHEREPRVRVVRLTRNFGQHPAVYAGFTYARGKWVTTIDADGQNPPEEIPKLVKTLEEGGYDFVQGWRTQRKDSKFRMFFSRAVNWIIQKITGVHIQDIGCGMAVFNRTAIQRLLQATHHYRYIPAEIAWMGLKIASCPITQRERRKGRSRYRVWSLFWVNFDIIASISTFPVEIMGVVGILFAVLGFAVGMGALLWQVFRGGSNASIVLMSFLSLLVGVQILCLSILCAYLSRTYREVQHRPYFIVEEVVTDGRDN